MKRHVYHYCASFQREPGVISCIDGISLMCEKIGSMEDYYRLKELVATLSDGSISAEQLVITNLSYLGEQE